jgi:glycine cleavage system H protein
MGNNTHKLEIFRGFLKFKSNQTKIWGVLIFLSIVTIIEVALGILKPEVLIENYFLRMKLINWIVEIESIGDELNQEEIFGSVEAVKTVSDLFIPVSGEITEMNENLEDNPELINDDPYGEGWIIKMKISDASELDGLLSADDYKELIGG